MDPQGDRIFMWGVAIVGLALGLYEVMKPSPHARAVPLTAPRVHLDVLGFLPILLKVLLGLLLLAALATLLIYLGTFAVRYYYRFRRGRAMRVDEIILGPNDTADPTEVMSALDAIHGQILQRYVGPLVGQNPWTFEIVRKMDTTIHFLVAAPCDLHDWLKVVEDTLRSKYTNIRFRPWEDERVFFPVCQQIVLAKHWRHPTETVKTYQNSVVETIVQAMDRAEGPVHFQIHMTPVPSEALHAQLRSQLRSLEHTARQAQQQDPSDPGLSQAERPALQDSLQLYGKKAFRTEIRLGATTWDTMQRVYGALREADGENTFRATTVWLFRGLWIRWLYARLTSPLLFGYSLLFSYPLATIIHLPTNRLRIGSMDRSYVRRAPAMQKIPTAESRETAMVEDYETSRPLAIRERDRKAGILIVGAQGSGKTTTLLSTFRGDVRYTDSKGWPKAVVLMGIGKDTERRALGMTPKGRKVYYYNPGDPNCPWTINPIAAAPSGAVVADNVLAAMTDVFGESAIQFRSREFLGNAFAAVREVMGERGDFPSAYRLFADTGFRDRLISRVEDDHVGRYWKETFRQAMAGNPRFVEEALAAPRNKLDELLRNPLVRATLSTTPNRTFLDMRRLVEERAVLVVNLDKAKLGDSGTRILGIFVVMLLWYALQAQGEVEEWERVPVSLLLDEAQNYLSESFLDMLAEGRAFGLEVTLAIRFLGEVANERIVRGMHMLIRNVILHQFHEVNEAKDFMEQFMRTWASMVQVNAESQDSINLGVDDLIRLPEFTSVCQWLVDGAVQPAFYAKDINWEPYFRKENLDAHMAMQDSLADEGGDAEDPTGAPSPLPGGAWEGAEAPAGAPSPVPGIPDGTVLELEDPAPEAKAEPQVASEGHAGAREVLPKAPVPAAAPTPPATSNTPEAQADEGGMAPTPDRPRAVASPNKNKGAAPNPSRKAGSLPFTLPQDWQEDDPRAAFCAGFNVEPARLLQAAAELGATDEEVAYCARWIVGHPQKGENAPQHFRRLLQMKVEDRLLGPVSAHLGLDRKALRAELKAHGVSAHKAVRALENRPNARTLDELLEKTRA